MIKDMENSYKITKMYYEHIKLTVNTSALLVKCSEKESELKQS